MNAWLQPETELCHDVVERAVSFKAKDCRIAGSLALPAAGSETGVVFVHGWSGDRAGPHGLLVHMARGAAEAGFPALRFDFRGRGESEGEGLQTTLASMAADLAEAVDFLRSTCGVRRVILAGICSGGNVAIGALPQLSDVAGLILLSVYPFSDGDSFSRDLNRTRHQLARYWAKACCGETWRRLFRGEVNLRQVLNVLFGHFLARDRNRRKEARPAAVESRSEAKAPPTRHLAALQSGVPGLMVYGSTDPDAGPARKYYEGYAREHRLPIDFAEIEGANHNFSSMAWTERVTQLATDWAHALAVNSCCKTVNS